MPAGLDLYRCLEGFDNSLFIFGTTGQMIAMAAAHGVSADMAGSATAPGSEVAAGGGDDDTSGGSTDISTASQGDFVGTYQVTSPDFTYDQWHAQQKLNKASRISIPARSIQVLCKSSWTMRRKAPYYTFKVLLNRTEDKSPAAETR